MLTTAEPSLPQALQAIKESLAQGRADEARCGVEALLQPASVERLTAASQVFQQLGDFAQMLSCAERASALAPGDVKLQTREIECQIYSGRIDQARLLLGRMERIAWLDGGLLQHVATLYIHAASHAEAHRCYERAAALMAIDAPTLYNLASSCVAMGELERAEQLFNRVIALRPDDFDAYQNRASLRAWSRESNHVDELKAALARLPTDHAGRVALGYALAKEYEDLQEHALSFAALQAAANSRRQRLAYRVEGDVAAMARIRAVFDAKVLSQPRPPATPGDPSLFVLGLPRSGTTLVDRILCSHSRVRSLGEINSLAFALMAQANAPGDKLAMIDRSAQLDFARLGNDYRTALRSYGVDAGLLLNKTPSNYLYLGLIHLALPGARVVHLRRHPLDSCYAMYKTLFRMGYPFSYSLEDLGHYYLAYHRLMAHWRELIRGSFHEIDYELLVQEQEAQSRALVQHCGLPWEDACLQFHSNVAPAATASASQVRRPLYASSVQRWRSYERELAPLADFLRANGVDCD
ncbi:sulfotransferase [Paucibacter sp. JuS9]|uniref:tetratricopeptide repeat-containing sulfotransferase family protein n=1 Tax=Paucibacter sp. JuS9 TaxID=3228748 RepID=UPI0037581861